MAAMIGGRIEAYGAELNNDALRTRLVGDACVADPLSALIGCIVNPLNSLPSLGQRYIVIDALDEALALPIVQRGLTVPQLLAHALSDFPPWLKLVITTRRDERITALFQGAERIRLDDGPQQREDVAAFLARRFEVGATMANGRAALEHNPDRFVLGNAVVGRSAGNFLYAQQVADAVDRGEIGLEEVNALPSGLGALFARKFLQYFPTTAAYADARRILGVILAAKQPLTAVQIATACGLDLDEQVMPVIERLTGYIVGRNGADGEIAYTVFHKSLADWLADPAAATHRVDAAAGRERLLAWCRDWQARPTPYPLRYLISHLLDGGDIDEALGAVRAGLFTKREGRMVRADLEDTMALAGALIERGEETAVFELATTGSPWQRDGAAAALIAAPASADPIIGRIVDRLAKISIAEPANPSADAMAARRIAMRVCEARDFEERLLRMATDKSPAVRVVLATILYRHWVRRRENGWRLLDRLAAQMFGFLSLPNGEVLEVLGHISLAILNNHLEEQVDMARLLSVWRTIARRVMRGPIGQTMGRDWTMSLMLRPLVELMKRQPAYQPLNARELAVSFARDDEFRKSWRTALDCLERPEAGIDALVEVLKTPGLPFDVYIMQVAERALICRGNLDRDGTFDAIERLFHEGETWFQQSALYALFHILHSADAVDDDRFRRYCEMTEAFFAASGATMKTSVAEYSFAPHLAWPEIVAEKHRRGGQPWILPKLLTSALSAGDKDRIERVFKAIDLVGFAYGRVSLALNLIEKASEIGGSAVEARLVECLANVSFQDEGLVDEFLEQPAFVRLKPQVKATSPSIRGEDIPTWVDGFVVRSMLASPAFHREYCAAYRRALTARSASECLRQILVWVVGLLASGPKAG